MIPPRWALVPLAGSIAIGALLGLLASLPMSPRAPWVSAVVGPAAAIAIYLVWTRRDRRRRRLASEPFPEAWRSALERYVGYYRRLDPQEKTRFENEVRFFLDEQVITGPRGAPVEDALRVLVAASAVILAFGLPGHRYARLRDVVLYEEAFDEEYAVRADGNVLGMVHAQGPILLSARSLKSGFLGDGDGRNVGLHELAHVLDFDSGHADGVPSTLPWREVLPWIGLMKREIARVKANRSVLRAYAATNEAELFAVATEAFFERPAALRARHPELYAMLSRAYGQDPAARAE
ncbi:MAG: zinc-dependent peptidase [Sandaracinaceae bacterium]|nr:zinc-dependent peptidase [Sandaracinaceae bacterium]